MGVNRLRECLRQVAFQAPDQFGRILRATGGIVVHARLPLGLQFRTFLPGVPGFANFVRNLERRMGPVQGLSRPCHFLGAKRSAVRVCSALFLRCAVTDHGSTAKKRWPGIGLGFANGLLHRLRIMPVDVRDHVPAVGGKAPGRIVGEPALGLAIDRNAVVVVEHDQFA